MGLTNDTWCISHHWLLIPLGADTQTDRQTHTHNTHTHTHWHMNKNDFKKPGVHRQTMLSTKISYLLPLEKSQISWSKKLQEM